MLLDSPFPADPSPCRPPFHADPPPPSVNRQTPMKTLRSPILHMRSVISNDECVCMYIAVISLSILLTSAVSSVCLQLSSSHQTRRLRVALFRAMLRQDLSWYDTNHAGELNTLLTE